jgi:hypothetical protein
MLTGGSVVVGWDQKERTGPKDDRQVTVGCSVVAGWGQKERTGPKDDRQFTSFYVSLVGGGLRLSGPSSGSNGSVRVYRRVIFGKQNWRCVRTLCSQYI